MNVFQKTILAMIVGLFIAPVLSNAQTQTIVANAEGWHFTTGRNNTLTASYEASLSGVTKVAFGLTRADISVEAHTGNKLIIEASGIEPTPDRAKGLKPVFNAAEDNTKVGLYMKKEGSLMRLQSTHSKGTIKYKVKIPKNINLSIEGLNWDSGDISVSGLEGELEVQAKRGNITAKGSFKALVLHSVNGDIEVVCDKAPSKASSITATSGFVDVTLPASTKATIKSKTYSGEMYSNFDIDFVKKDTEQKAKKPKGTTTITGTGYRNNDNSWGGQASSSTSSWGDDCDCDFGGNRNKIGKINGGGVEITLKSTSNDIYLRKK